MRAPCPACEGEIVLESGRYRDYEYKGVLVELPEDVELPACLDCGEAWFNHEATERLSEGLERAYQNMALAK